MMQQGSLFDALRGPAQIEPCDPDGPVIQGRPHETVKIQIASFVHARVQIHQHRDGRYMWGTAWQLPGQGSGYQVGPKWGKFAESRDDALHYGAKEIIARVSKVDTMDARKLLAWARSLL